MRVVVVDLKEISGEVLNWMMPGIPGVLQIVYNPEVFERVDVILISFWFWYDLWFFLILLFSLKKLTSLSEWSNPMFGAFEVVGWICWTVCNMNQLCNPPSGFHGNQFNIFFASFKLNMNDSNPFVEGVWPDVRFFKKILLQKSALFMAWILLGWHQNNAFNCIQTSN